MKKIALIMAVVFMAATLCVFASAADDYIIIDFRTEEAVKTIASLSASQMESKQFIEGAYEVVTDGGTDPWVNLGIKTKQRFEAADYPVLSMSFKVVDGTATKGQIFYATTTKGFTMGSAGSYFEYPIDATSTDWQLMAQDMELIAASQWFDKVKQLRLDLAVPNAGEKVTIAVRYVGLFKTEKEALAFDYDEWAEKNAPATAESKPATGTTTAPEASATTPAAPVTTPVTGTTAPVTADPFTAVAVVMAVSAGAALTFKKRR